MTLAILQIDTEPGWRGGQRQTFLLARELARLGHRSHIAALPDQPLAQRALAAGIPVIGVRPRSELAPLAALTLWRFIRSEGIQIVHAQSAHAVALAALATLGTRARIVVTRHLARPLRRNVGTRWKYDRAAAILAVSRAAADALVASGISPDRVEVVHGGVELRRDTVAASASTLAQLGVPAGAPLAVLVGALVPQKDPLTFVRAVAAARAQIPELHALIVGDGELRPAIEGEIAREGIEEAVHLAGFRNDVDALLAAGSVAVLSSRFEGLPLTIMDAFVLGVPVAATAGDGIPELVSNGTSGLLVPVGDERALGRAIVEIVRNPARAARLAEGGRVRARELSIERTTRRTLAAYERVLEDGAPPDAALRQTASARRANSGSPIRAP